MHEAKRLAIERMREIDAMPWEGLARLAEEPEETELTGPSGRAYRGRTSATWDYDEETDLIVETTVRGRGLGRLRSYRATEYRSAEEGEEERAERAKREPSASSTYLDALAGVGCLGSLLAVLIALVGGFAYAVSRVQRWL